MLGYVKNGIKFRTGIRQEVARVVRLATCA